MLDKVFKICMLFDFYGKLLSKRQFTALELYYIHDLSLSEIGEQMDISRQGAHDLVKRGENRLYKYEKTLGLVEKFNNEKDKVRNVLKYIDKIRNESESLSSKQLLSYTENIERIVMEILENNQEVK